MASEADNSQIQKSVTARRMVGAFGGNVASLGAAAIAGFVNTKIYVMLLGRADFGLVMLIASIAGWTVLGDIGFGTAVRQRMTVLLARGEVKRAARVLSSGIAFYTIMAAVMFAALIVCHYAGLTSVLIKKQEGVDVERAVRLLFLGISLVLLTFPLGPLGEVLLARNDFFAQNLFAIISALLRPAVGFVVLSAFGSVEAFLVAMNAYTLLVIILKYAYVLHKAPELRAWPSLASIDLVKSLVTPSLAFFIISVAFTVVYGTGNAVISWKIGLPAVAAYAVAFQIFGTLRRLCVTSGEVLFPAAGILDSRGEHEKLQKCIDITTRMSMTLAVLGGIGLLFLGGPFIGLWVGPTLNPGYGTLLALGALLPVGTLVDMTTRSVCGVGRHHMQAVLCVLEIALNLSLSITLAPRLGVMGVALGILLARTVVTPLYVMDGMKQLKLSMGRLVGVVVLPNIVLSGALFGIATIIAIPQKMSWPVFLIWSICYAVLCAAILVALMPRDVRQRGTQWLSRRFRGESAPPAGLESVETTGAREE